MSSPSEDDDIGGYENLDLDLLTLPSIPSTPEALKGVDHIPDLPDFTNLREGDTTSASETETNFDGFRRFNHTRERRGIYKKPKSREPVRSCGVLCFMKSSLASKKIDDVRILMVRRKDSLAYVEFLRGKYKPSDPMYVRTLLRGMTRDEHTKIQSMGFDELWFDMWKSRPSRNHLQEYHKSRGRFEECKDEVRHFLTENPDVGEAEPEWTFPKGRPNRGEDSMTCALREFQEESNISSENLTLQENPMIETYTGTNGIVYQNIFYIGETDTETIELHPDNFYQKREISGIEWVSPEDGMNRMRHTYPSREHLLREAVQRILIERE
jgi:8-oxo-dGTP pyrophosphatase MutT (NUDIX family)